MALSHILERYKLPPCFFSIRYDLPWWDKLFGASFKNGRFQLRQLTGGKQDDLTVLVAKAELSS